MFDTPTNSMQDTLDAVIVLPRLRVENVNAISGPLTWGFPAPSAFAGFVHALHRKHGSEHVQLEGAGIVCHSFEPQIHKHTQYQYRFNLARHPVTKEGKSASTVEQARAHMVVSLVIGVRGYVSPEEGQGLAHVLYKAAMSMRLAGGSVCPAITPAKSRFTPEYVLLSASDDDGEEDDYRMFWRRLLPGFALVSRQDLLHGHLADMRQENPQANVLDALLDLSCLHIKPPEHEQLDTADSGEVENSVEWNVTRAKPGWLVPLPVGYGAISSVYEPGQVRNARDNETPVCFVESLYSLGEWLSPTRLSHPGELLWYHQADPEAGTYLCKNEYVRR